MSYEPITYCRECGDAFDVYHAPEERICSACKEVTAEAMFKRDTRCHGAVPTAGSAAEVSDKELFREYYHPRDPLRRPCETDALREEIRRRVDVARKQ